MALVEEYYELNETENMSTIWKALQIGFYACAACLGLGCGFTLAISRLSFDDRCYLFTEVKTSNLKDYKADQSSITWESDTWCDYYQFTMVSSFIVAIIWATFFLMCGKGGKSQMGLPQPWRIVWPSLIFNFIYFVIILSTAIDIQQGTDMFCGRKSFNTLNPMKSLFEKCEPLKILLKKKDLHKTLVQLEIVVKTSWGCVGSWFILFLLSFFRIVLVVDFDLYKICVFKIDETTQNKKEGILKITNYEEPKKLHNEKKASGIPDFDYEETFDDLEMGMRKKKFDKNVMPYYFNTIRYNNRSPLPQNATFYMTADIRMLQRDKYSKALNKTFVETELRNPIIIQSSLNATNSNNQTFLHQRSKDLNDVRFDINEMHSSSRSKNQNFSEDSTESESNSELFGYESEPNFSMSKKQI